MATRKEGWVIVNTTKNLFWNGKYAGPDRLKAKVIFTQPALLRHLTRASVQYPGHTLEALTYEGMQEYLKVVPVELQPSRSEMIESNTLRHRRVRAGAKYVYQPVMLDKIDPPYNVQPGDVVVVVNLPGCPKANTMGHCHVNHLDGSFAGLVCTNSLQPRRKS